MINVSMDHIIKIIKNIDAGYRMGIRRLKILYYADDAILVAETGEDLQRLTH